jgi:hypothetical protein
MADRIDWNGLLKWSTNYHDGTKDAKDFKPLSQEDKDFLEGALAEAFGGIEDANETMKEALEKIDSAGDDTDVIQTALEVVDKCCDFPDVPRNLDKLGGVDIMLRLLQHKDVHVAAKGAALFTIMLQMNSEVQKATAAKGGLEILYKLADRGEEAFFRAVSMMSALIRHEPDLEKKFVGCENGHKLIEKALSKDQPARIRTKGASLLRHLLAEKAFSTNSEILDQFAGCVAEILPLDIENIQYGETIAALTSLIYVSQPRSRARADEGSKKLIEAAQARITALKKTGEDRSSEIDLLEDLDGQRRASAPPKREEVLMLK